MEFFQEIIYLKKTKDGAYVINLDEYADTGTHWVALFCKKTEINQRKTCSKKLSKYVTDFDYMDKI